MSERTVEIYMDCLMCTEQHTIKVREEDYIMYNSPNRPHVQDIFPYLTPAERELLISGFCEKCWEKLFPTEPEECEQDLVEE